MDQQSAAPPVGTGGGAATASPAGSFGGPNASTPIPAVSAQVADIAAKAADMAAKMSSKASQQAAALSAQATSVAADLRPAVENGKRLLLDKPALMLGGAFVLGIALGRLV